MRRILIAGLTGLFLLGTAAVIGCGSDEKAQIPDKMIDLPKEGPIAAGAGGKGKQKAPPPPSDTID
jgi:hypothetical protein